MSENTEQNKKTTNSNQDIKLWAAISVILIFITVLGYRAYLDTRLTIVSLEEFAQLGDSFGILSSLFSGLAFAGLIVTIVMQNKTLKLQMDELREARAVSELQKNAIVGQEAVMNKQFKAIQIQQFETTFFNLLDLYEKSTDEIVGGTSGFRLKGLDEVNEEKLKGRDYLIKVGRFFINSIDDPYDVIYKKYESKVWSTKIHNHIDVILYVFKYVEGKDNYIKLFLSRLPVECYILIAFELHLRQDYGLIDIVIKNRLFRNLELDLEGDDISKNSYLREIFQLYPKSTFACI